MDTIQIRHVVNSLYPLKQKFIGVFPIDKLHRILISRHKCCIINTAPSTHKGQHWVAIYFNVNRVEFFDSYGLEPQGQIKTWLRENRMKWKHNRRQVQNVFTATCGAHCLYYL